MGYKIDTIAPFRRAAKKLIKKYPSLKGELVELERQLLENPITGAPLGNSCYKVRLAIASKGKGKSGGARVITHIHVVQDTVYMLYIYDKLDQESISDAQLKALLKYIQ